MLYIGESDSGKQSTEYCTTATQKVQIDKGTRWIGRWKMNHASRPYFACLLFYTLGIKSLFFFVFKICLLSVYCARSL